MRMIALLCAALLVDNCDNEDANHAESNAVDRQQQVYTQHQPVPQFDWSLERSLMIQLYQARNRTLATYSYVINSYTGAIIMSCPSMGFPIPATTQLTNPETTAGYNNCTTIQQAEPNGLYAPPVTHGTWIMCLEPDGTIEPRYVENDVIATVRPMQEQNGHLVPVEGQRPSLTLHTTR